MVAISIFNIYIINYAFEKNQTNWDVAKSMRIKNRLKSNYSKNADTIT